MEGEGSAGEGGGGDRRPTGAAVGTYVTWDK